jgi:hypothetical protein
VTDRVDLDRTYSGISFGFPAQPMHSKDDRAHHVVRNLDEFLKAAKQLGYEYTEAHAQGGRYTFEHPYKKCAASLMLIDGTWQLFNAAKPMVALTFAARKVAK